MKTPGAVKPLLSRSRPPATAHSSPGSRRSRASASCGIPAGYEAVASCLSDPDRSVRKFAAGAIGNFGRTDAVPLLQRAIQQAQQRGETDVVEEAQKSLRRSAALHERRGMGSRGREAARAVRGVLAAARRGRRIRRDDRRDARRLRAAGPLQRVRASSRRRTSSRSGAASGQPQKSGALPRLDFDSLLELLRRLDGRDDASSCRLRWIVTILLLRRRLVRSRTARPPTASRRSRSSRDTTTAPSSCAIRSSRPRTSKRFTTTSRRSSTSRRSLRR